MAGIETARRSSRERRRRALSEPALAFRRRLLRWYGRHRRDLPWRGSTDPYAVLVSEIMLQQTQVSRVEDYFRRFLGSYPTLEDLAAAPAEAVREIWAGLGYYARARNLQAAARHIVGELDGRTERRIVEGARTHDVTVGRSHASPSVAALSAARSTPCRRCSSFERTHATGRHPHFPDAY